MPSVAPRFLLQSWSTMLAYLCLVSFSFPVLWSQTLISCSYKSLCQQALLSGNDIVLRCDHKKALWYFSSIFGDNVLLLNSWPNIKKLPGGSLQLTKPQPWQAGLFRCEDDTNALMVEYEIDFQDASTLHITHKDLGQKPLQNETLNLGGKVLIFTHWEPWQDCNRCGEPGERKRLGYCYVEEPPEKPMPCWLYLRDEKVQYSRLRPEMQVEGCFVPCDPDKEIRQPFFIFDIYQLGKLNNHMWLTCPLASIYRPIMWEANGTPLTWQSQLSGHDFNTTLDTSTGGRQLRIFQPSTYKCYVHQEFMAQFSPIMDPEVLEDQESKKEAQQWQVGKVLVPPKKADSVLKGLKLMLLVVFVLALVGLLFRVFRPVWDKRKNSVLLVK